MGYYGCIVWSNRWVDRMVYWVYLGCNLLGIFGIVGFIGFFSKGIMGVVWFIGCY